MRAKLSFVSLIAIFFGFSVMASMAADSPTDIIKKINKDIEKITSKKNPDIEKIIDVLEKYTSFEDLSNSVLDKYCKKLTDAQCTEIKGVFIELLKYSTSSKLSKYKVENTEYLGETIKSSTAVVKTKVKSDNRSVKLNYEFKKIGSKWKIVNYIVDDVDTIKNYKKQFRRLFKKNTFEQIIKKLEKKIAKYKK